MVRLRFAPSPTGPLHIGGVRTALYNYLFAKQNNGTLILRIEDTDQTRFVSGAEQYIIESLQWLGITFDEGPHLPNGNNAPYRQSERKASYRQFAEQLIEKGLAYYAFDTSEELEEMRKKLEASKMMAKYDAVSRASMKNSLTLSNEEVNKRLEKGEDYVIRIKLPRNEEVRFHDEIRGWVVVNSSQMDDKVLLKSDGMPTYHLANVVDDYNMGITHVIRGEEWLPSAPLHILLYRYLGWEVNIPTFAHLPLLLKPDGQGKLSKRDGDRLGFPVFPLEWEDPETNEISTGYRESGYLKEAVVNMLALLGWHPSNNQEVFTIEELIAAFSLAKVSKSGAKFDLQKAHWFNQHYITQMSNDAIAEILQPEVIKMYPNFNLKHLPSVIGLSKEKAVFLKECITNVPYLFEKPSTYDEKTRSKKWNESIKTEIIEVMDLLRDLSNFSKSSIEQAINEFAENKGNKPFYYFPALRLLLTGEAGGPPIFDICELLGQDEVIKRLEYGIKTLATA